MHWYSHSSGKEGRYTCVSGLQCGISVFCHSFAVFCFFAIAKVSLSVISSDLPNSILSASATKYQTTKLLNFNSFILLSMGDKLVARAVAVQ